MPVRRDNGGVEPLDSSQSHDLQQWDALFLEAIAHKGHLSSDELIALGVSHGLTAADANAWINDAAARIAIEPIELGAGADTRWRIAL